MTLRSLWFAMLAAPLAALASPAGFVLELRGEWRLEGTTAALAVGSEVPAGGVMRNGKPTARDSITIVASRTGKLLLATKCAAARDCEGPVAIPPAAAQDEAPGAMAALLEKVAARLRGSPTHYVATITRSERVLSDAVVELAGGHLAMAPALAGVATGIYEVALRPLPCPGGRDCAPIELASDYRWDPAAARPLPARGVAPGLFELEATPSASAYMPQPSHAWVRVSTGERFARNAAAYRAAQELVTGWGSEAGPAVRQTFLRGVLASLDD
jgi:hypothetical protein